MDTLCHVITLELIVFTSEVTAFSQTFKLTSNTCTETSANTHINNIYEVYVTEIT